MNAADFVIGSIAVWRRARATNGASTIAELETSMQKTIDVLLYNAENIDIRGPYSIYRQATSPGAYPELTTAGNAELTFWPHEDDELFHSAAELLIKATGYNCGPFDVSIVIGGLCAWREDRSGGCNGMQAVINVLENRAALHKSSIYRESVMPMQFSAMTAPRDPELVLWPAENDENFADAQALVTKAINHTLEDLTAGAVSYYAKSMKTPPYWAATMIPTVQIGGQLYFKLGAKA